MRQGIESSLPENRQKFLDGQALHWGQVLRQANTALEFATKARSEYARRPQISERHVVDLFETLICCLKCDIANAAQLEESAIRLADPHYAAECGGIGDEGTAEHFDRYIAGDR